MTKVQLTILYTASIASVLIIFISKKMSCRDKLEKRLVCTLGFTGKGYDILLLLLFPFSSVILTVFNPKIYGSNHLKSLSQQ